MHASLKAKMMKSGHFATLVGIAVYFALLTNALASEAEGGHHLNWTDFAYRTVAFIVLVAVLVKLLRKPIVSFLNTRREEIERLLAELEAKTSEARSQQAVVQARLASLERETRKIVE